MGEIRIVGPGETRGYPYPVCKKRIISPGKTREYPHPHTGYPGKQTRRGATNAGSFFYVTDICAMGKLFILVLFEHFLGSKF